MLYCDVCGKERDYPINTPKKAKGSCEICKQVAGPMNLTDVEDLPFGDVEFDECDLSGFHVKEVVGFPPRPKRIDYINPAPHRLISSNVVVFIMEGKIEVADLATGRRIHISPISKDDQ